MRLLGILGLAMMLCSCASPHAAVYPLPGGGLCHVHHVPMQKKIVQVSYGFPAWSDAYVRASARFPHADKEVNGGCDPSPGPRKATVYVCPECKRAQLKWARAHPSNWKAKAILQQQKSSQAMQRAALHSVSPLRVATSFNLQPGALLGAVADLVSR
jgi:recombinational DNA repair protein (RecF pathway)